MQGQFFDPLARYGYRGTFDAFLCNGATFYRCECTSEARVDLVREFRFSEHLGQTHFPRLMALLQRVLEEPEFRLPESVPIVGERIIDRGSMVNLAPGGRPHGANLSEAARASREAKLVKLADKICNLRDVAERPPAKWDLARRREYFEWSKRVIDRLRGTHPGLEAAFDAAYRRKPKGA